MVKRKGRPQGIVVAAGGTAKSSAAAASSQPAAEPSAAHAAPAAESGGKKKKQKKQATEAASAPVQPQLAPDLSAASAGPAPPRPWVVSDNEAAQSQDVLSWLIWPMTREQFFSEYWEKKPLHLRRGKPDYYEGLFTKADVDRYLRQGEGLAYGEKINLAKFDPETAKRVDLNGGPRGTRAPASAVDAAWRDGATMQVMHPQQFHSPAWALVAGLERSLGTLVGANSYLTPVKGRQGLAPHFDDVEVFMLQVEGAKRWRLHVPPEGEEYPLARDYSRDFTVDELGEQLLDCSLETGDLLYLPRGTVHFGVAEECPAAAVGFSHHLTVSAYQKTAWCNFMERALSSAMDRAASSNPDFRVGLPINFLSYMGSWHDQGEIGGGLEAARTAFKRRFRYLFQILQDYVDLDEAGDELGVDFMAQRMPPHRRTPAEASSAGSNAADAPKPPAITVDSRVRWVDPSIVRLMVSNDPETSEATVMVFHSGSNDRSRHMCRAVEAEEDVGCLRFEAATFLSALRLLSDAGTEFVRCGSLPISDESDRVALCESLAEAGLLELAPAAASSSSSS